jgi:protein-S-isoprenylcysteine O-methyltransferase Ste14
MILFLKNLFFTVVVPGTVAVLVPNWLFPPCNPLENGIVATGAGGLLVAFGTVLFAASIWRFGTVGQGTPAPIDAPRHLVVVGPYRYVRNPMYIGVLSAIFGQALMQISIGFAVYGLVAGTMFSVFVVAYEEIVLARRFGDQYQNYCERVPRWIPRKPREELS